MKFSAQFQIHIPLIQLTLYHIASITHSTYLMDDAPSLMAVSETLMLAVFALRQSTYVNRRASCACVCTYVYAIASRINLNTRNAYLIHPGYSIPLTGSQLN